MSRPMLPPRTAHSVAGSVSSPYGSPVASTWTPSTSAYADADFSEDVISPLSALQIEHAAVTPRARALSGRSKHRRASSLREGTSLSDLPLPTFEKPEENKTMAPLPKSKLEVVTPGSASMSGGAKTKPRPRHQKAPRGTGSLDLSKSRAENEDMGVYTSLDRNDLCSPVHHRAGSMISQNSVTSDVGSRLGSPATFVHPMRQTPQSFTHPLARIHNNNYSNPATENDEEEEILMEPSPIRIHHPSFSSPSNRRPSTTVLSVASNSTSQTNLRLVSPTDSPHSQEYFSPVGTPATARSSFDSMMFGNKKTHCPNDPDEFAAEVQRLRRVHLEKQRAKDEKIAAKETKAREKQLRKDEKLERKSMSRRNSKLAESSASEDEDENSGAESYEFPLFDPPKERHVEPWYENRLVFTDTSNASISTPPEFQGPPIKRARRRASNTWGKLKFDATTFRIHVLRTMGLRTRD